MKVVCAVFEVLDQTSQEKNCDRTAGLDLGLSHRCWAPLVKQVEGVRSTKHEARRKVNRNYDKAITRARLVLIRNEVDNVTDV